MVGIAIIMVENAYYTAHEFVIITNRMIYKRSEYVHYA